MKKLSYIIMGLAVIFGLSSCEDWLEMPSESKADSGSIFETMSRAEMTVVGAYLQLHSQELGYQLLMGTDECLSTESNSKYDVSNYNYTNLTSILSGTYNQMYKAIEYSNVCIAGIPSMGGDEKMRNQLLGEALAIRAYAYWNLVRFYGDVPYSDRPTSELSTFSSSRVSRDTIYDHCIADLQKATELLAWKSEGLVPTTERFTKNAAYGILARVALYAAGYSLRWDLNTYDKGSLKIAQRADQARIKKLYEIAANACKAVIEKGENDLLDNYDQVFRDLANQAYNKETLLEYGMYGSNAMDVRTGYTNGMTFDGTSTELGKCAAQMVVCPTLYFEFDNGDQRRDVSIVDHAIKYVDKEKDEYRLNTYAGMGVGKYRINWKKTKGTSDSKRDMNWPLLRFSDVLLMYAEALNELNGAPDAEAINAVKRVRRRAFRNDESKIGNIPTTQAEFRNFIIKERKLELNNEGLRKSDLFRWGIHYEHLTAEKQSIVDLCNHAGKYAGIKQYRAWNAAGVGIPHLNDPTISLAHIDLTEEELASIGLSAANMTKLHTLNASNLIKAKLYEAGGKVYLNKDAAPADAKEAEYTIINMWSISTVKQKGNLAVVDNTDESKGMISSNNTWITGATGIFYGMKKNMTEIIPLHATNVIDVNPGLAGQQHPAYQ